MTHYIGDFDPFKHRIEYGGLSTIAAFGISASMNQFPIVDGYTQYFTDPVPDTRRYFDPTGKEETKEEFDLAMDQWRAAMDEAMRAKAAEDERLKQESSWKARFDKMIKAVTEF